MYVIWSNFKYRIVWNSIIDLNIYYCELNVCLEYEHLAMFLKILLGMESIFGSVCTLLTMEN